MLSYRHAFHAGNHADVLKHAVQALIIESLKKKDKPFIVLDTHAGGGLYDLRGDWSQKKAEYVASELEKYFGFAGFPHILHTDNGKEFIATLVVDMMMRRTINVLYATLMILTWMYCA